MLTRLPTPVPAHQRVCRAMRGAAIRVLLAGNEASARRRLMQFLACHDDVEVVGEARNGLEACAQIARLRPDLVFLDVEMPDLNGLEVVCLVKPFDHQRFGLAMEKARRWLRAGPTQFRHNLGAVLKDLTADKAAQDRILVRSGEVQHLVRSADIVYISAEGNYIRLHTVDGQHLMRERMAGILERLDGAVFRRIHRSHIVNMDHVKKLLPWFDGYSLVMMADGSRLTLSRHHRDALREFRAAGV